MSKVFTCRQPYLHSKNKIRYKKVKVSIPKKQLPTIREGIREDRLNFRSSPGFSQKAYNKKLLRAYFNQKILQAAKHEREIKKHI